MNITNEERINKYIQEHCINCKNKQTDLCEIHIFVEEDIIKTNVNFIKESRCFYMYEKHDIEEMLKSYLIKSARAKELQRKIEANNALLEYNRSRLIQTDKETIEELALSTPKTDIPPAKTNKISNSTERIALSYKSKLVRINEVDKLKLINENASYYEKLSPLLDVINKVNIMLSALDNEQRLVIETYYFHEPKWAYVANVYYDVYKEPRSINRLQIIRNKALDIMLDVVNV